MLEANVLMANDALRVLALAERPLGKIRRRRRMR
jgi:hypothetical protein